MLTVWHFNLLIVLPLFLAGILYAAGVQQLWRRAGVGHGVAVWRTAAFGAGLLTLFVAFLAPLEAAAQMIFSAHMVQHLLLLIVAAPLLVLGCPPAALAWSVPRPWRRPLARWWQARSWLRHFWHHLNQPLIVWALYGLMLWMWHIPLFYDAALRLPWVHAAEHATFFGTALLFWRTVLQERQRLGYAGTLLFIFTTALHSGLLAALMVFAKRPWYGVHPASAAAWGLTPLTDQQLAGAIMWVPAGIVYVGIAAVLLHQWLEEMGEPDASSCMWNRDRISGAMVVLLLLFLAGCGLIRAPLPETSAAVEGGNPERGWQLLQDYGCHTCHTIPDVPGATTHVGPPLTAWANRQYIAGSLTNDPENLIRWIQHPQEVEPGTVMPNLSVTEQDARDMSAYLYLLRAD